MSGFNRWGWSLAAVASLLAAGVLTLGPRALGMDEWQALLVREDEGLSESTVDTSTNSALGTLPLISRITRQAREIRIEHADSHTQSQGQGQDQHLRQPAWLSLSHDAQGHWKITSLADWPARQDKVTALLGALAEAQLRERKPSTDKTLAALGLNDSAPILTVASASGEIRLQLGDKPSAAPVAHSAGAAKALPGRYVRWLSSEDAPVLELSRYIGLPDWRGGMATSQVIDLATLRPLAVSRMEISMAAQAAIGMAAMTRGLAPDSAVADHLVAALSPLKQNDLRLRSDSDDWQAAVTLRLHWPQLQAHDQQQLTLAIEAGSKPWARLTLVGSGWPVPLAKRLRAVEIQVNGALREQLIALVAVVEPPAPLSEVAIAAALGVVTAIPSASTSSSVADAIMMNDESGALKGAVKREE